MRWYSIIRIKVLCPKSGSHRKVKQNENFIPVKDSGSMAVFKDTTSGQRSGAFGGHSIHTCTYIR